jgi:energy-coupling factor transporter ATP-binding protein EcfA2
MNKVLAISALAQRVLAAPPRCGSTRLVCIDGPSGSGKSTLAARLATALGEAPILRMDDLYPGWDGLAAAVPLLREQVIAPLVAGLPASYRRYDWNREEFAEEHDIGTPPLLVVEGVAAGARIVTGRTTLLAWVQAPRDERFRRGIARDGETYRPHWERWARQEEVHFAAEGTAARADLRVDGAPTAPFDPEREIVLLPCGGVTRSLRPGAPAAMRSGRDRRRARPPGRRPPRSG